MANYYAAARTNYFWVKDDEAFEDAMQEIPSIEVIKEEDGSYCILGDDPDGGGWPTFSYDEDDNETEIDLVEIVSQHLKDEHVAVFMESGSEKLRYVTGYAEAINNKGDRETISLVDIYGMARKLGSEVTTAEY